MFGTIIGNIIGITFFLSFQLLGIWIALYLFQKETLALSVLLGSAFGSFALHWLPTLYAFLFDFTIQAHVAALVTFVLLAIIVYTKEKEHFSFTELKIKRRIKIAITENPAIFFLAPLFIYVVYVLLRATIPYFDGAMHSSQCTYGDMNMHLGFVTSIANQKTFPPEYSILPGTRLAYPFLSDSISSSIYIWGSSLRIAYLVPMFFAMLQVFFGAYTLMKRIYLSYCKQYRGKTILALVLFFLNGGIGFIYFLNKGVFSENFTRIFTAFYETPTNYVTSNIQWHNIICDMLIPQRATLFGWAMLFPILIILHKATKEKQTSYFVLAAIMSAGLSLIHTHSFLALGILCAGFVVLDLFHYGKKAYKGEMPFLLRIAFTVFLLVALTGISMRQMSDTPMDDSVLFMLGIVVAVTLVALIVFALWRSFDKEILTHWGLFLSIVLVLALPILFAFTFQQASGENFVRGFFNWANSAPDTMDNYIIFYIKNLGIMFFLTIAVIIFGSKQQRNILMPALFLWLIAEFIVFQPNTYDNNKLMLVSYFFFCVVVADFVWETIPALCKKANTIRIPLVTAVTILGVLSAVLTMGREAVADFELYSDNYIDLCKWIEENTEPDDVFLTSNNHNNAIASLTGRNIICGSGSFLYFHGLDYTGQEENLRLMFEDPTSRDDLLDRYNVSYIVIGPYEYSNFSIPDIKNMVKTYELVYNKNGVLLLAV